jgi:hypothetical protein
MHVHRGLGASGRAGGVQPEGDREIHRIEQYQRDAVLCHHPRPLQHRPDKPGALVKLAEAEHVQQVDEGCLLGATGDEVGLEEISGGVGPARGARSHGPNRRSSAAGLRIGISVR